MSDKKSRYILDTNITVSAVLLPKSLPRKVFDWVLVYGDLLVSEETLAELNEVLCCPEFDKYVLQEKRLSFLATLVRKAELVDIVDKVDECCDKKDDKLVVN